LHAISWNVRGSPFIALTVSWIHAIAGAMVGTGLRHENIVLVPVKEM
jgi:hypothetical protein